MPNDASVGLESVEFQRQGEAESTFIDKVVNNPTNVMPTPQKMNQGLKIPSALAAREMFVHEPLKMDAASIRLVEVLPRDNGTIKCAIKNTTLGSRTIDRTGIEYTCLSYVWGPPEPLRRISVNGKPFHVRQNLFDFLQTASVLQGGLSRSLPDDRFRYLWIDALCIDQESTIERNHQVQQMGRIYSAARKVIVWMGDDPDIYALFRLTVGSAANFQGPLQISSSKVFHMLHLGEEENRLLRIFCTHEYWRRAWITQEVILAREIDFLARTCNISLRRLRILAAAVARNDRLRSSATPMVQLDDLLKRLSEGSGSLTMVQNFELYRHKRCVDIRDLAYSLLAVSRGASKLKVDYGRSRADLARDLLALDGKANCLCHIEIVLRGLRVYQERSIFEDTSLLVEMRSTDMLRHMSPCSQCGEIGTIDSLLPETSANKRHRFICLHCNHNSQPEVPGLHRRAHLGHLAFAPDATANEDSTAGLVTTHDAPGANTHFERHWTNNESRRIS